MNRIVKIATLLVALIAAFSFSQENLSVPTEKPIVYDTVHRIISDSVTIKALENSQTFYSNSFNNILVLVGIVVAIGCAILTSYFWRAKREYNEKTKIEFEKNKNMILKLEKELKEKIENTLEYEKKKNQEKFDTSFRFLSRIYRKFAEESLEKDNFDDFFYFIYIFYRCLKEIELLNNYDLDRLRRTHKMFSEKQKKITLKNKDNICWFVIHLLKLIKYCNDNGRNEHSGIAKLIYNDLFNFNIIYKDSITHNITSDNIEEELRSCMEKYKLENSEIQEILKLAKDYKNNSYALHV